MMVKSDPVKSLEICIELSPCMFQAPRYQTALLADGEVSTLLPDAQLALDPEEIAACHASPQTMVNVLSLATGQRTANVYTSTHSAHRYFKKHIPISMHRIK